MRAVSLLLLSISVRSVSLSLKSGPKFNVFIILTTPSVRKHSVFLPALSCTLPLFAEVCKRSARFIIHSPCSLKSGIRQGGVLSPLLFNIYIGTVINSLEVSDLGCHTRSVRGMLGLC